MTTELSITTEIPVASGVAARFRAFGAAAVVVLPALAALVFVPQLASPFLVPKSSLVLAVAAVCGACAVWNRGLDWRARFREPMTVTLYVAYVWLGVVWALSPLKYMGAWSFALILAGLMLFESARLLVRGSEARIFAALSVAAALISVIALAQFAFHLDPFRLFGESSTQVARMRVFGTLGNTDFAGEFLAACLPAICSLTNRNIRRTLLTLNSVAILCTGSRAALLAAAVAALVWIAFANSIPRTRKLLTSALIALLLLGALLAIVRWNVRPMTTAMKGRITIWRVSLHRLSRTGTGVGTFSFVYLPKVGDAIHDGIPIDAKFITPERHAQNDLVETIVETGAIGGFLCVLFVVLWTRAVLKRAGPYTGFALATAASILTTALFDFPLHRGETVALLAVTLALPFAEELVPRETSRIQAITLGVATTLACFVFLVIAALPVISSRYSRIAAEAEFQGELPRAEAYFSSAASMCPDNTDASFSAARVLAQQGKYRDALLWSSRTKLFVAEPELWLLRARILESMNENELALAEMQNAQRMFPYSPLPKAEIEEILSNSSR